MKSTCDAIINSALWAAFGDALGFITELVDVKGVQRRIKSNKAIKTLPYRRLLGGKYGVNVELPAGCYSDDTQLRLATSRAIGGDGHFDVEIFAKIELPIWLSYCLGAGIGSKAAAEALKKPDVNWFSNFFSNRNKNYLEAGGDGAAMRIQPHVWSASDRADTKAIIRDVVRNSICTHGHARGFLGSVYHALCLSETILCSEIPGPDKWEDFTLYFRKVVDIIENDTQLSSFWLPTWQEISKEPLSSACEKVIKESIEDIKIIRRYLNDKPQDAYYKSVESIGCLSAKSRGSGIKTAILANANCWFFRNSKPSSAIETSANTLNSDTDTISTMVGAIVGVLAEPPDYKILDREYIIDEAARMYAISNGEETKSQEYPDLFGWIPPKTQADSIGYVADRLALAGISFLNSKSEEIIERSSSNFVWQWFSMDFGQTIISRRRKKPIVLPVANSPIFKEEKANFESKRLNDKRAAVTRQSLLWEDKEEMKPKSINHRTTIRSIDDLFSDVKKTGFKPDFIGKCILYLSELPEGVDKAIAFSAIVARAYKARLQSKKNSK